MTIETKRTALKLRNKWIKRFYQKVQNITLAL